MPKKKTPGNQVAKVVRDANGRFVKGSNPNPAGRPKMADTLTVILREYGQKKLTTVKGKKTTHAEYLASMLWSIAVTATMKTTTGDLLVFSPKDWHAVVKFIYDRVDGKPTERLEVDSPEVEFTSEDIRAAKEELEQWKKDRAKKS